MDDKELIKSAKSRLLAELKKHGVDEEGGLIVAGVRKTRKNIVGYYSHMSQFRGRARIVVDPAAIRETLREWQGKDPREEDVANEVFKTISHEYGHMMAEAIRFLPQRGEVFDVPAWQAHFDNDEEEFAEDFARYLSCQHSEYVFWDEFMPRYAAECRRLYTEADDEAEEAESGAQPVSC